MKVLYITASTKNSKNAASTRINNLLPLLKKEIELKTIFLGDLTLNRKRQSLNYSYKILNKILPIISWCFNIYPMSFQIYRRRSVLNQLKTELKNYDPEIIHLDGFQSFAIHKILRNRKVIFHSHDAYSKKFNGWIKSKSNFLIKVIFLLEKLKAIKTEKKIFKGTYLTIVDSKEDQIFYSKLGYNSITVPLGFNPEEYDIEFEAEKILEPNIVMTGNMGSLQTETGIQWFSEEIYPFVKEKVPNINIYLVGGNPSKRIIEIAKKNGYKLTGFVENLNSFLKACNLYIYPSKIGSGMKTRTLEALAMGCSIISTEQGLIGIDIVDDEIKRTNDAREFTHLIIDHFTKRNKKVKKPKYLKKLHEDYSWKSTTHKILKAYQQL